MCVCVRVSRPHRPPLVVGVRRAESMKLLSVVAVAALLACTSALSLRNIQPPCDIAPTADVCSSFNSRRCSWVNNACVGAFHRVSGCVPATGAFCAVLRVVAGRAHGCFPPAVSCSC